MMKFSVSGRRAAGRRVLGVHPDAQLAQDHRHGRGTVGYGRTGEMGTVDYRFLRPFEREIDHFPYNFPMDTVVLDTVAYANR